MKDFKEKAKKFWKENKKEIVIIGVASICSGYCAARSYKDGYMKGTIDGCYVGFHATLKWLEEHYPETKATELWENYKTTNPDQIVHRKGPGKWA